MNTPFLCLCLAPEEFGEEPVAVGMAAYLGYPIKDCGDMHRASCPA